MDSSKMNKEVNVYQKIETITYNDVKRTRLRTEINSPTPIHRFNINKVLLGIKSQMVCEE
jgi:hypothetical protein